MFLLLQNASAEAFVIISQLKQSFMKAHLMCLSLEIRDG